MATRCLFLLQESQGVPLGESAGCEGSSWLGRNYKGWVAAALCGLSPGKQLWCIRWAQASGWT